MAWNLHKYSDSLHRLLGNRIGASLGGRGCHRHRHAERERQRDRERGSETLCASWCSERGGNKLFLEFTEIPSPQNTERIFNLP